MVSTSDDYDVLILEADGLIDESHGYGFPIQESLHNHGISSGILSLPKNAGRILELIDRPTIISGGMTEVTANIDWIIKSKEQISKLLKNNTVMEPGRVYSLLGICFGAQLIAESYSPGSVVFLNDPEIGVSKIRLKEDAHPLFKGFSNPFTAYSFHYNQIKNSTFDIISSHKHMGHSFLQAFEVPKALAYGVQFHPEFTKNRMKVLFQTYSALIADFGFDVQPIVASLPDIRGNDLLLKNFYDLAVDD